MPRDIQRNSLGELRIPLELQEVANRIIGGAPRTPLAPRRGRSSRPPPKRREIRLDEPSLNRLLRSAAPTEEQSVVWAGPSGELLVRASKVRAIIRPGVLVIGVSVFTEESGDQELSVPFMLGDAKNHLGLSMACQRRPVGDPWLANLWGESVAAFVWETLLNVLLAITERSPGALDAGAIERFPGAVFVDGDDLVIRNRTTLTFAEAVNPEGLG
jgi:hypothetical protein